MVGPMLVRNANGTVHLRTHVGDNPSIDERSHSRPCKSLNQTDGRSTVTDQAATTPAKLILLPGLGADAELFYPQQNHFGDELHVCEGPSFDVLSQHQPSLKLAAEMMADSIAPLVSSGQPYVLGGMSFGGSLAMQMVAMGLLTPSSIVLISANRTSNTVSSGFRWQQRIGSKFPTWMIRSGLGLASKLFARREQLDQAQADRLAQMAQRADIRQLLWGAAAIDRWQLSDADLAGFDLPIHQIHGVHDWVVPIHRPHVTDSIDDGRHLIAWTHSQPVNECLESAIM